AGAVVVHYIPDYAYLIAIAANAQTRLASQPNLRWIGDLTPSDRIQPRLAEAIKNPGTLAADNSVPAGQTRLAVHVARANENSAKDAEAALTAMGATVISRRPFDAFDVLKIELPVSNISSVPTAPNVFWVELVPHYELHDERAAQIIAGNFALPPPLPSCTTPGYTSFLSASGISGSGVLVSIMDSGLDQGITTNLPGTAHADLLGRIEGIFNATTDATGSDLDGHGTINAGIIMGNATLGTADAGGFKLGQGIAPQARIYATKIFRSSGPFDIGSNTFTTLATDAAQKGAAVSSNSWGSSVFGEYNSDSQEFDALVRDANTIIGGNQPMTFVFSAGNSGSGSGSIGSPATGKNVIAVGASENCDANGSDGCGIAPTGADSLSDLTSFTSRGPADDGRLGVTLVAPGSHIKVLPRPPPATSVMGSAINTGRPGRRIMRGVPGQAIHARSYPERRLSSASFTAREQGFSPTPRLSKARWSRRPTTWPEEPTARGVFFPIAPIRARVGDGSTCAICSPRSIKPSTAINKMARFSQPPDRNRAIRSTLRTRPSHCASCSHGPIPPRRQWPESLSSTISISPSRKLVRRGLATSSAEEFRPQAVPPIPLTTPSRSLSRFPPAVTRSRSKRPISPETACRETAWRWIRTSRSWLSMAQRKTAQER
ncbi:S8 family serine peptidase, partial [Candidatus Sumerlaeota bacterium]|nr:S8 family serine peptidase [Candidatus Sumerlaeota bacterium]